jgi:aspartate/methionine/tyrosine aminotransferase
MTRSSVSAPLQNSTHSLAQLWRLRAEATSAPSSGIVEVFNYGRDREGLIPLWVGEGDLPMPGFVAEAMTRSIEAGETFYTHQRGIPELRDAIAHYMTRIYAQPFTDSSAAFTPDRFFVTVGGMHAVQIAMRLVAGTGDDVLVLAPAWPNFEGALNLAGAHIVEVPLATKIDATGRSAWYLDLAALEAAITSAAKVLVVNSPSNPTGWTAAREDLEALLTFARAHQLWIIADEIYGRITFTGVRAPSFHDVMKEEDRVLFVQSCSKNWAMTGLRIGWLEAPAGLSEMIENLIQYSTSGVAVPLQRAAIAALDEGELFFADQLKRLAESRAIVCETFAGIKRVHFSEPQGAFYAFCRIDGIKDTRELAFRWIDEAGVGVAPGTAFGAVGRDYVRLCFARDPTRIAEAMRRLKTWFKA